MLALWDDLNRKLLLNSDICAFCPYLLCCICSSTRKRRVNTRDRSLTHSFVHPEQSEPQFLNVRHKSPPPKLNLVYGACVPESYTLPSPSSLNSISTHRQLESKTACMPSLLLFLLILARFRRQPAGSPTRIQTLTRLPDHRGTVPRIETLARLHVYG